jgi:putative transposase
MRSRFTEEQIIAILREQEADAATAELYRWHGISQAAFCNCKAKFGGMEVSEGEAAALARGGERQTQAPSRRRHARQRCPEGSAFKEMVTPAAAREAAARVVI